MTVDTAAPRRPWPLELVLLGVVTIMALAGCGGGKDKPSPPTTSPLTTSRPVDTSFSGAGSAEFCNLSKSFSTGFSRIGPNASTAQLKANLDEATKAIHQAVDVAPAEIKADVKVIADGFTSVAGVIANANYDLTKVPPDALATFQSPDFSNAAARLQAYLSNVCGIKP